MLLSEINEGRVLSILIDVGETMDNGAFQVPIYTYRNFPRRSRLTVEQSLASLGKGIMAEAGVQVPEELLSDCVRLCCSLCPAHGAGVDRSRPSGAQDRPAAGQCGASGTGGKGAERVWRVAIAGGIRVTCWSQLRRSNMGVHASGGRYFSRNLRGKRP
jgi:hypothetical protein